MAKALHSQVSWSAGEWSPKLDARNDQQKYGAAMRQCQNMIPYKSGGLTRRPGTQMVAPAKLSNTASHNYAVQMIPFTFSPTTTFQLEFGHHYVRFYSNGLQVTVTASSLPVWSNQSAYNAGAFVNFGGTAYYCVESVNSGFPLGNPTPPSDTVNWLAQEILEIPSPYGADAGPSGSIYATDVYLISVCQINDVIYITHPDYPPYSLTRFSDLDWVMQQVDFNTPALLDQNATDTMIAASAVQGNGVTLTASAPAWVNATYYTIGNSVEVSGVIYNCVVPNVSASAFLADFYAGFWVAAPVFNTSHDGSVWQLAYLNPSSYLELDGVAATGFASGTTLVGGIAGTTWASLGGSVSAGSFSAGATYVITAVGTTNFTLIGASGNVAGTIFTATGAGAGTGTANLAFASPSIQCLGSWEVHSYGVWVCDVAVQRSVDGGQTFQTVRSTESRSDRNVDITGTAVELGFYRVVLSLPTALSATPINPGATNPRVVFEVVDQFLYGLVQIVGVSSPTSATANVVTELANTSATEFWSEAAWSEYRGYPQAVASFQQRVVYASSGYEPQRIWGTVTNDIENFALGDQTEATDSFAFDLNAPSRGPIQWLIGQTDLIAGLSGAEWVINSGSTNANGQSSGAAITPTQINAVEHSTWGTAENVQPIIAGDAILYVQRQGTSIRQMQFSFYTAKYMSQDLTMLSEHLFSSGIVQAAFMTRWRRQSIIWVVTQQGSLCGMTYEMDQEVFGWHRHLTGYGAVDANGNALPNDNGFESVSVNFGEDTAEDEVWVVANRLVAGTKTRFIERINPNVWEETFTGAPNPPAPLLPNAFYFDGGSTITGSPSNTITGLSYLNGRYVVGLADGQPFGPLLVSGGSVAVPASQTVGTVQVGLSIPYAGQPMRMDADAGMGNTQGLIKQFDFNCYIRVWNSIGGSISNGTSPYPNWTAGTVYFPGQLVVSPITQASYECVVEDNSFSDPSTRPNNWVLAATPSYQPPVPIPYTKNVSTPSGIPFAVATFVSSPEDKLVPPQLMPSPGQDPKIIVQGSDALPLTVLAIIMKMDVQPPV